MAPKDRLDLKDQTYFGFSKTEDCLPMTKMMSMNDAQKWKMFPTNQNYKWVTLDIDAEELPENILPIVKYGDDDIYMCREQVNGKIHPGVIGNGTYRAGAMLHYELFYRHVAKDSPSFSKFVDVCNHCCDLPSTDLYDSESNGKQFTPQKTMRPNSKPFKLSALCIEEGASVEWVEIPDFQHPTLEDECDFSKIPKGAVIGGVVSGLIYYVGRGNTSYDNNTPGIFYPRAENTQIDCLNLDRPNVVSRNGACGNEMLVVKKEEGEELKMKMDNISNETRYFGLDNVERLVTSEPFSVLRADPEAEFDWVEYEDGKLPIGAVIAGVQDQSNFPTGVFYVGRGIINSHTAPFQDMIIPGIFLHKKTYWKEKSGMKEHTLFALYDGKVHELENFHVLVVSKHAQPKQVELDKNKNGKPKEAYEYSSKTSKDTQEEGSFENCDCVDGLPQLPKHIITLDAKYKTDYCYDNRFSDVAISKENRFIYSFSKDESFIKIWDMSQPPNVFTAKAQGYATNHGEIGFEDMKKITNMKLSQDSKTLIASGAEYMDCDSQTNFKYKEGWESPTIQVLDLSGTYPSFKTPLKVLTNDCLGLALSPDGRLCYTSQDKDRAVRVWDLHNQECVGIFAGHTDYTTCIDLSHDGTKLWSAGKDKTVRMWDIRSFGQLQQHEMEFQPVDLASSPSGDWLVVNSEPPLADSFDSVDTSNVQILHGSKPDKYSLDLEGITSNIRVSNSGKWLLAYGYGMVGLAAPKGTEIFKVEGGIDICCTISNDDSHIVMDNKVYKL